MFILKSVVGKLWITIIGLVVVVLLTLSLFLFRYIETSFPKSQDQAETLSKLAVKAASEISLHQEEQRYLQVVNELLSAQDASVIIVTTDFKQIEAPVGQSKNKELRYNDLFMESDLQEVFAGEIKDNRLKNSGIPNSPLGGEYTAVAVPFMNPSQSQVAGALILYQITQSSEETQAYVKKLFVVVGVAGFLMTTFFAFFLLTRITQPIQQLKKAAHLISMGEYGTRVPITSTDEIGELGQTFNHMGEELSDTIKALSHEKEHLASILRSMADAVITFDADGRVILTNPQGDKIIQDWNQIKWSEDEPVRTGEQTEIAQISTIPIPLKPFFEAVISGATELTSKLHVKSEVWSVVMAPLYSHDIVRGVVAVIRNVTEEFRLDKLRKDFVANVSHELRTPLSMMQGYSEALIDDIAATPEERKELAQVIHDESLRMGRLVRDLLDLAKMETGKIELHFSELDVSAFLKRIHRKFAGLSKERGIVMSCAVPSETMVLCRADEDRLEQVLTNLLDNALRHTPAGAQIEISASEQKYKGKQAVLIEVSDQGYGIPAEDIPFIFERFYKADKARTRGASGGTGLGLAIVKNIVEAHQGTVQVKSQTGQGTTFSIMLPCKTT
ncbi:MULTISPECIES: ATP-binding protein [unclassified Paenibacillus]|uniref:ATP-binding protein n=1 Tax=unclassified Paenibacillus TaxID=185978 RepID=UPI001AE2C409|nr:two-component system sensor histidine kinase ResE [Paenibacillus sp. PvP091]MBP1169394.1 two-component system sensor histidine kinase ResE [Paenibacillus sp. PvR098]MBP2440422.1 two-component system sensor histidine kinase ResE [Paenibacillus sp. PvP052]